MSGNADKAVVAEKTEDDSSKLKTFLSILRKYDYPRHSHIHTLTLDHAHCDRSPHLPQADL